jgi:hypothetical protein
VAGVACGFEICLSQATGWHLSRRMSGAFMVRDAMMLAIWARGWFGNTVEMS